MRILVTGSAGFIGFFLIKLLCKNNYEVIGIDNLNTYYDVNLKKKRLQILKKFKNFSFHRLDIKNEKKIEFIFKKKIDVVVNLAAMAGVRHSLKHPMDYIDSNIVGFVNLIKLSCDYKIKHFIYASSSSVYGNNKKYPSSEKDITDSPASLYGATKKSNEIIASAYSSTHKIKTTGLRFFTVYGPWGRPDMALFYFYNSILRNKKINIFNKGNMLRDFTYVEDVAFSILKIIKKKEKRSNSLYKILNIGNSSPIHLKKFIFHIEKVLGKKSKKNYMPMQIGDVKKSLADCEKINEFINFKPKTSIEVGIKKFHDWYTRYYAK